MRGTGTSLFPHLMRDRKETGGIGHPQSPLRLSFAVCFSRRFKRSGGKASSSVGFRPFYGLYLKGLKTHRGTGKAGTQSSIRLLKQTAKERLRHEDCRYRRFFCGPVSGTGTSLFPHLMRDRKEAGGIGNPQRAVRLYLRPKLVSVKLNNIFGED